MKKNLVIVGAGEFAKMAYINFTNDSEYNVISFAVEKQYKHEDSLFGLDIICFEDLIDIYPPEDNDVFVAITHVKLNSSRERIVGICKQWGYTCATYISSCSYVSNNSMIGENVFVFENTSVQHFAEVGDGSIIWNGVNVCHSSKVGKNCWIAPGATLCGFTEIGNNVFIGAGSVVRDEVKINANNVVGLGSIVIRNIDKSNEVYVGNPANSIEKKADECF